MENNTTLVDVATGEVTHGYTEPHTEQQIVIDYDFEVNKLIRQRYTASQEFAILRQKEEKPERYQEYYDYCEQCKREINETFR